VARLVRLAMVDRMVNLWRLVSGGERSGKW
jgi:hypothetical protein